MGTKPTTDYLAAAKAILDQPADDLGDHELAQAHAHALVACADLLGSALALLAQQHNERQYAEGAATQALIEGRR